MVLHKKIFCSYNRFNTATLLCLSQARIYDQLQNPATLLCLSQARIYDQLQWLSLCCHIWNELEKWCMLFWLGRLLVDHHLAVFFFFIRMTNIKIYPGLKCQTNTVKYCCIKKGILTTWFYHYNNLDFTWFTKSRFFKWQLLC